jgi:hypothetical protein
MISIDLVRDELSQHDDYISAVELAMILEASAMEVRQRLNELGKNVVCNDRDEWRLVGSLVQKLELSTLSASEIEERDKLENTVQQAFFVAGQSLKILRERKLYRETHSNFESYVKERFDYTKRAAYYLIDAYEVVNTLKSEPLVHFLPTSERQCREVAKLPAQQQPQAWLRAVEKAGNKVPSGKIVKEVVNEIEGKPPMESKPVTEKIVRTQEMETEYLIYSDRETCQMLEAYRQKIGVATKNNAIRRLLEIENQPTD